MSDEFEDIFAEEDSLSSIEIPLDPNEGWQILIVDDDKVIHDVTEIALEGEVFEGKYFKFIHCYSAKEAIEVLSQRDDVALILLDVVMEDDHAGFEVVEHVRKTQNNHLTRVILRTGQPGQAPEKKVIIDYEINDYKSKTEMTNQRLFTSVVSAIRSYRDLINLEKSRQNMARLNLAYKKFAPSDSLKFLNKESIVEVSLGESANNNLTIMFLDIRSFTSISEKISPKDCLNFLNSYMNYIGPLIEKNHGIINKYLGDGFMAIFDREKNHANDSVNAALEILTGTKEYNLENRSPNLKVDSQRISVEVGIGINLGPVILGTVGTQNRFEFTVIGDTVNCAARVQELCKEHEANILITDNVEEFLTEGILRNKVGEMPIRGRDENLSIWEIIWNEENIT